MKALLGHKFNATCPRIAFKLLSHVSSRSASSPNNTTCLQSSQIVPKSSQIDANHHRMSPTHRIIALDLICDIIESLSSQSYIPKSTPVITEWSPHHQKRPLNSLSRSHSASLPFLMSLTFLSSSPKLNHNSQNLSPLTF